MTKCATRSAVAARSRRVRVVMVGWDPDNDVQRQGEQHVPYPEYLVAPMREELTSLGVKELRTADAVDDAVKSTPGTLMIIVNSVCGCAAGKARPGIALALNNSTVPDVSATVFAGADTAATDRARGYFT